MLLNLPIVPIGLSWTGLGNGIRAHPGRPSNDIVPQEDGCIVSAKTRILASVMYRTFSSDVPL